MDINKLRAFLCIAKYRNFTKASEELFISQPALSKKILDFERELGVCLMKRNNRTVELTPAGTILYTEAPVILNLIDDLSHRLREIDYNQNQQITIACSGVESDVLAYLLHTFQISHPDIIINLRWCSSASVRELVISNSVDFGFQINIDTAHERNIDFIPLIYDELNVIVGQYHPLASVNSLCLKDIANERYIAIKSANKHLPFEYIMEYFRTRDISFKGGLTIVDSLDTMILYVSTSLGISTLSSRAKMRYGDILHFIPLRDCDFSVETNLVWNYSNINPARDIFINFVRNQIPKPLTSQTSLHHTNH